jgi:hypothetical protein
MGKPHNGNTTQKKLEYHTKKNVNTTPKKIWIPHNENTTQIKWEYNTKKIGIPHKQDGNTTQKQSEYHTMGIESPS